MCLYLSIYLFISLYICIYILKNLLCRLCLSINLFFYLDNFSLSLSLYIYIYIYSNSCWLMLGLLIAVRFCYQGDGKSAWFRYHLEATCAFSHTKV